MRSRTFKGGRAETAMEDGVMNDLVRRFNG